MAIDPRIALGVQPLQVQYRDPIASYNQLAQLTSADTQNQLAQMQMQEHMQMAPYRMQQAQTQAASAQLTYDQAKQAQDFVIGVMSKAAEHPEAPQDPMDAAMQMLQHPNPQVQAVGGHLLDASQKLMAYRQQAQFMKDESGALVAPTPAGAPAVTAPSVDNVAAPMVAPSAAAPNVASALSDFAIRLRVMPGGITKSEFSIGGQPVSEEEYTRQREALMLPQQANNLAAQVAPAVAAAPAVNAMIPAVASALQNADALKKEIEKGDRTYGSAPGWKAKRELLVEAYKQALKPGRVGATSEFEQLLNASGMSETEKQDMRKAKLAKETAKPSDKPEAKSEFEKLLADSGLTEDQKQAARQAKITKETTLPVTQAERKSEFEKLLEDSGLSDTEKQAMRKAKLDKETAKPSDRPEARSEFEKLLAESGLSEEQKQAARQSKITKETTAAVSQAERKTDFEKLLEDSGLSETEKQDMRKAKLAKETSTSAAADSQFERTMTALGLSDAKKNALRAQLLAKEVRIPVEGGGGGDKIPTGSISVIDPTDPAGKRVILVTQARAIKEGLTPASSTKEAQVPQAYRDRADKLQNVYDSVSNYARVLDTYKSGDILNLQKRGQFSTAHATALLQAKELFNLGVLNGGDEVILNKVLASPVDFSAMTIPIATIKQQVADLKGVIDRSNRNLAKTYKQDVVPLNTGVEPAPAAAANSAMSAADAIINKGRR